MAIMFYVASWLTQWLGVLNTLLPHVIWRAAWHARQVIANAVIFYTYDGILPKFCKMYEVFFSNLVKSINNLRSVHLSIMQLCIDIDRSVAAAVCSYQSVRSWWW